MNLNMNNVHANDATDLLDLILIADDDLDLEVLADDPEEIHFRLDKYFDDVNSLDVMAVLDAANDLA